jgi:hypothetical protein
MRSEVQREHRAEERPSAEERAKETNPQRVDRAGERPKAEEPPHERKEPNAKARERVESDVEEQSHVGAETKEREKSLERLGDAVERQWSSIEKAWDIAITHLPDEQSVRKMEMPLKTAGAMLKRAIHTTERMAKEPDKQDEGCETNDSNQDGERERGCEKNKKQNYVWQPDATYITSKTNEQQHSRWPDTKGSSREKIDMDQNINQDDFLDKKGSGNEARIRRVSHKYTPSEIMAATKSKISTKRNSEQNKANESGITRPKTRVTQRTRIKESDSKRDSEQGKRTNNEKESDGIDVTEIQTYARDMFKQRGRAGDIVCITLSGSGTSSSSSVQSCGSPVDTDDEHDQCHKQGSKCPDIYGHTRAGTNPNDHDHYFTDGSDDEGEANADIEPKVDHEPKAESQFEELQRNVKAFGRYYRKAADHTDDASDDDHGIATYVQRDETVGEFLSSAVTRAIASKRLWDSNNNPRPQLHNKENRLPVSDSIGDRKNYRPKATLDYLNIRASNRRGKFDRNVVADHPSMIDAARTLAQKIAKANRPNSAGDSTRSCNLCESQMTSGYKDHVKDCGVYRKALKDTRCPICEINLQSSGRTMLHLKYAHKMLDHGKRDEPVEDVVIDKDEYLEAARLLYPAPANGPIPEYPDHSKRKAGNDEGHPLTEEADTSPQPTQRPAEENNSDEEPEG